jgi:hypothetical protein
MIRKLVCKSLNRALGGIIEEISPEELNISLTSGKASLENVKVRSFCIQEMGLPVSLNAGTIGSIELDIPVKHLKSRPVVVKIKDVLISLSPNPDVNVKKVLLLKAAVEFSQRSADDTDFDMNSKIGRLVTKIVDNIVIIIEDVHIRIEDTISSQISWHDKKRQDPKHCFSVGVTLDHVEVKGCLVDSDGSWQPGCLKKRTRFLNKRAVLGSYEKQDVQAEMQQRNSTAKANPSGVGIYCHLEEQPLDIEDSGEWVKGMRGFIASKNWRTENNWILSPVSASAFLSLDKNANFTPCSSRVWARPEPEAPPSVSVQLSARTPHSETVPVAAELLVGGAVEVHWQFTTSKVHTRFCVRLRNPVSSSTDDRRCDVLEPSQALPSHLKRVSGFIVMEEPGELGQHSHPHSCCTALRQLKSCFDSVVQTFCGRALMKMSKQRS